MHNYIDNWKDLPPKNKKKSSVVMVKFDSARKAKFFKQWLGQNMRPEFFNWWEIEMI